MGHATILSVGGSILVPDGVDVPFLRRLVALFRSHIDEDETRRLVLVIGGGSTARTLQQTARDIDADVGAAALDDVGIAATRLNAELVRALFGDLCPAPVFVDPTKIATLPGRIMVGGGWKPGFSTDTVAVHAAEALGAQTMINLTNIRQIYTADPKTDPTATPLEHVRWPELIDIVGDIWSPGANTPFDPVATQKASALHMTVITADGRDLENLRELLAGRAFVGTTVTP